MIFGRFDGAIPSGPVKPLVMNMGTLTRLEFLTPDGTELIMAAGIEIDELEALVDDLGVALERAKAIARNLQWRAIR